MKSIDELNSIVLKRKKDGRVYDDIVRKLEVYDYIVRDDKTKPFIESISKLDGISKTDKFCLNFIDKMQDHLWRTISILSSKNQLAQAQNIRDDVVNEICNEILVPSYFGFESEDSIKFLNFIKDAIETHYRVCIYYKDEDEVKKNE